MAYKILPTLSPRHGIQFDAVPTRRGSVYGGSVIVHHWDWYGSILDCVFEMSADISAGNGVSSAQAIEQVLKDEGWTLLPKHKKMLVIMLNQN